MSTFNPSHSFGIVNSRGFYNKLLEEYQDFDKYYPSARFAMNCAVTSWHMTDWVFEQCYKTDSRFQFDKRAVQQNGLARFQEFMISKCDELKYMRDISNGAKHCILEKAKVVNGIVMYEGDFSFIDYNRKDYAVDEFVIQLKDGSIVYFEEGLEKIINFWEDTLKILESGLTL